MGVTVRRYNDQYMLSVYSNGARRTQMFPTKQEAERMAVELRAALLRGTVRISPPGDGLTLGAYASRWLEEYVKPATKYRTYERYESALRCHVLPVLGNVALKDIRSDQIDVLLKAKRATLKPNSIKNILIPLRELLNHAVLDKLIPMNPALLLDKRAVRKGPKTENDYRVPEIFSEEELGRLLSVCEHYRPQYADLIHTVAWSGLREGEAFGLHPDDVDYRYGYLDIRRNIVYRKRQLIVGTPKARQRRRVKIPERLVSRLRSRNAQTQWLFPNEAGQPLYGSNFLHRVWYPLLKEAGLRRITFQDLRHTYASLLLKRGEPIKYVSEQLGHADVETTMKLYWHLVPNVHRGGINALAEETGRGVSAIDGNEIPMGSGAYVEAIEYMEPAIGIEPTTCGLRNRCSTN
jgi:integrase